MKTSAILNPSTTAPNAAPKTAQPGAAETDRPFGQVLSREVAERREAEGLKQGEGGARAECNAAGAHAGEKNEAKDSATCDSAPLAGEAAAAQLLALVTQLAQPGRTAPQAQDAVSLDPRAARQGAVPTAEIETTADTALPDSLAQGDLPSAADDAAPAVTQTGSFAMHAEKLRQALPAVGAATHPAGPAQAPEAAAGVSASALAAPHHAAAAAPAADRLLPRVGSGGWDQALGQKMVWMVSGAQQSASLTLNPPDLGPLQVVLNVSNAQATANFIAAQPEVRQALEAAMPRLREMLGDAGIQLGESSVSAGTPQQHGAFGEQRSGSGSFEHTEDKGAAPLQASRTGAAERHGLVDTFA